MGHNRVCWALVLGADLGFAQMNVGPMCWWSRGAQLQREGLCGMEGVSGSCLTRKEGMALGCVTPKPRGYLGKQAELQDKEGPWQDADVGIQPWDTGSRDSGISCLPAQAAGPSSGQGLSRGSQESYPGEQGPQTWA